MECPDTKFNGIILQRFEADDNSSSCILSFCQAAIF